MLWDNSCLLSVGCKAPGSQIPENNSAGHQDSGAQFVPLIVGGNPAQVQPEATAAVACPPL